MEASRSTSAKLILRPGAAGVGWRHSGHATEPSRWTARTHVAHSEWPHSSMSGAAGEKESGEKGQVHTGHSHVDAEGAAVSIGRQRLCTCNRSFALGMQGLDVLCSEEEDSMGRENEKWRCDNVRVLAWSHRGTAAARPMQPCLPSPSLFCVACWFQTPDSMK